MSLLQNANAIPSRGYDLEQSLRFNDDDTPHLSRTPSSAGNRKTWTWSGWIKRGTTSSALQIIFNQGSNVNNCTVLQISSSDTISFVHVDGGSNTSHVVATPNFRDPAAWYHLVFKIDTTESTAADRVKIYVNGEEQLYSTTTYPSLNMDTDVNSTDLSVFGQQVASTPFSFDGYLAEVHLIDGTALTPASFGQTKSSTNQWVPKQVTGLTYGTNGFYQKFSSTDLANSFTDDHVLSTQTAFTPSETLTCDILLVGGGGSGGNGQGGGGGAGQVRAIAGQSMSATSHAVTVAYGGDNANAIFSIGSNGGTTSLGSLPTAIGGGGGGSYDGNSGLDGASGGGGGGREGNGVNNVPGGSGSAGNNGGQGTMRQGGVYGGNGGGGGAGGAGSNGVQQGVGGAGGIGVTNDYRTGSAVYYGGGGGGADYSAHAGGAGGQGGGGRAATTGGGTDQLPGEPNTGGGGGGGAIVKGAAGGSGIVVVRYQSNTQKATGGTVTTYGSGASQYYVHSFTDVAHTITANGDVANSRAQAKIGDSSIYFSDASGANPYLTIPDSSDWDLTATADWTWEFWLYRTTTDASGDALINRADGSG
ncbi:MAG: LamG domain-containing protein, partial [bacterium]|nr:LamG domain-containing protein [bacterium]